MFSLISQAYAQTTASTPAGPAGPAPQGPASNTVEGALMQFAPLFLIFAVFYFLLIRPQQKKYEQHKKMVEDLRRGDRVITGGGVHGTVVRVEGDDAVIEIAPNLTITVVKNTLTQVLAKTEPDGASSDQAAIGKKK